MKIIIAILLIILIASAALLVFLISNLKSSDLSFNYIIGYLIDGSKMPIDFVSSIIAKVKDLRTHFSWWIFY